MNRQGFGERFVLSSSGFAIYSPNSTVIRVELRDSERRWVVEKSNIPLGYLQLGFTWSKVLGLTVVFGSASISVERNTIGEIVDSPVDDSTHLMLGRPNNGNQSSNYFKGSIDNFAIFEYSMTSSSVAAVLKGNGKFIVY